MNSVIMVTQRANSAFCSCVDSKKNAIASTTDLAWRMASSRRSCCGNCTHIERAKHRKMRWDLVPVTIFPVTCVRLKTNATRRPVAYIVLMATFAGINFLPKSAIERATEAREQPEAALVDNRH